MGYFHVDLAVAARAAGPGAAGVDMFRCWRSWALNISYAFPPAPMLGLLVTFLPSTGARAVVATPNPIEEAWWTFAIQPHASGVVGQVVEAGFTITAFDFARVPRILPAKRQTDCHS